MEQKDQENDEDDQENLVLNVQLFAEKFTLKKLKSFLSSSDETEYNNIIQEISKSPQSTMTLHACCLCLVYRHNYQEGIIDETVQKYCIIAMILLKTPCVDVTTQDSFNKTVLHYLVHSIHSPLLETLAEEMLHSGLDINTRDYRGRTALHLSRFKTPPFKTDFSWDEFLIKNGACIHFRQIEKDLLPVEKITTERFVQDRYQLVLIHLKGGLDLAHLSPDTMKVILQRAVKVGNLQLLRALVEAGGKFNFAPDEIISSDEWEMLIKLEVFPLDLLALKRLAANVIRVSLRPNAVLGVEDLGIPRILKDYITLSDFL